VEIPPQENPGCKSKVIRTRARFVTTWEDGAVMTVLFALPLSWQEVAGRGLSQFPPRPGPYVTSAP
jgi:hypothetical protein